MKTSASASRRKGMSVQTHEAERIARRALQMKSSAATNAAAASACHGATGSKMRSFIRRPPRWC